MSYYTPHQQYKWLYKTPRWVKESKQFLRLNPICYYCDDKATLVNHRIPHKGNETLFWQVRNWQPACKHCHDSLIKKLENGKILGKDVVANNKCDDRGIPQSSSHPWNL
jgi:5-methylcytosine-specific restriction endonuclease McrA